ncbi:sialidase family protein [Hydrogenophaga defluvii]|uniref:Sialidase family protein n=2 Tax=Hydrogenophaga defluvii TaxID=249410 RepID=A0ABW2S8F0_9BURK
MSGSKRTLTAAALLAVSVLAGCSVADKKAGGYVSATPIHRDAAWAAVQSPDGDIRLAYYDAKRQLYLANPEKGTVEMPFHSPNVDRASSGLALAWVGGRAFVGFRDKEPQRDVFVAPFDEPKALVGLGAETIPLSRLKMAPRGDKLASIWYGEEEVPSGKVFHVYYRELDAKGKPLAVAERLFEGIYPTMSLTPSGRVTAVSWVKDNGKDRIIARSKNGDQPFGAEIQVADIAPVTPLLEAINDGERTLAFWHAQYGRDLQDFRLEGAYTDDGAKWERFHLKAFDGLDIETGDFAADGQGNIAVVASVVKPQERQVAKKKVLLAVSHDRGKTWSDAIELRQDEVQKDKPYSHARAPKVAFLGAGQLFVAWQDWRSLRSAVQFSYSEDAGRTWKINDQRLTEKATEQEGLGLFSKSLFAHENTLRIVTEQMTSDAIEEKHLRIHTVTRDQLTNWKPTQSLPPPNRERLEQRVIAYWKALQAREFETTYSMLDPYFRARMKFDVYKENLGKIEYRDPVLKLSEFAGPIALAVTKMTVEVKPFVVNNRTMKMDPAEREIPTRWLWIDGDWYLEFYQESRDLRFTPF